MACLAMYNSDHKMSHHNNNNNHYTHNNINHLTSSPRISFSNDFVDAQQAMKQEIMRSSRTSTTISESSSSSSDFEFSVTNNSMMSPDELFFKGRLLPAYFNDPNLSNNNNSISSNKASKRTLRDELLQSHHDDVTSRQTKGSSWKSLLGLKRAHSGGSNSKKTESNNTNKTSSQDFSNEDVEIGI